VKINFRNDTKRFSSDKESPYLKTIANEKLLAQGRDCFPTTGKRLADAEIHIRLDKLKDKESFRDQNALERIRSHTAISSLTHASNHTYAPAISPSNPQASGPGVETADRHTI
jgi:hypothetical protein